MERGKYDDLRFADRSEKLAVKIDSIDWCRKSVKQDTYFHVRSRIGSVVKRLLKIKCLLLADFDAIPTVDDPLLRTHETMVSCGQCY